MDTIFLQSTLNKAREQFENGHAKACVETLKGVLGDLKVGEPEWYRLRNDTSFLLSRLSGLERERGLISEQNYMVEWNKLFYSTNQLVLDFEAGVKEIGERKTVEEKGLYKAELVLGLDYRETDMEEIKGRILRLENILQMKLGLPERITGTRAGSVIVEMNLYAEEIVKIRSLVKLGLVDDVLEFKVLNDAWDWIEGEDFVLWLEGMSLYGATLIGVDLSGVELAGTDLRRANLSEVKLMGASLHRALLYGANLHGADLRRVDLSITNLSVTNLSYADLSDANLSVANLSFADLSFAKLSDANLNDANLNDANLSDANLSDTNLSDTDLSGADLNGADLSGAYLIDADLIGTDLRGAQLIGSIFYEKQRQLLESMEVDISKVVFVDDEGKRVENLVEVD